MITNLRALSKNLLRKKAFLIANAGYEAIKIPIVIKKKIKLRQGQLSVKNLKLNLNNYQKVFLLGVGKGSALASATLAKILGKKLTKGIALDVQKPNLEIRNWKLEIFVGTHPLPSQKNVKATQEIIKLVKNAGKNDLIIAFVCGGGSALLCGSAAELKASKEVFKKLTKAGADISELNTVRKHLSIVKGGGLAQLAYPATLISLIVSDVPTSRDNLSMVASGPTVFDKTTKKDAEKTLRKFRIKNSELRITETPKQKKYFRNVKNILFVSNRDALLAMAGKAKKIGLKPKIYSLKLKGEAKSVLFPLMKAINTREVVLAGGETTVTLRNQELRIRNYGRGGRNMESVLGVLNLYHNSYFLIHNSVIISFASDGRDNTEAAGAIGDNLTIEKAKKLKLEPKKYLENHNSFNFFKKTGDLIYADKKSFNVADLMLVLSSSKE